MGTLLLSKVKEEYPDKMLLTYSCYPSPKVSDVVVEPYNAILSIQQLIENADEVMVADNEALFDICHRNEITPTFDRLNELIARNMSGTTCSLRFAGQLNSDLRKLGVNLIPFPRLHFFLTSNAPLFPASQAEFENIKAAELMSQCFDPSNMMAACDPRDGKYMTAAITFRGEVSTKDVDEQVIITQKRNEAFFCEWIPNNIKSTHCAISPSEFKTSATFLGNNTAMMTIYERIIDNFESLFNRKAYVHWYTEAGMDLSEFDEARSNCADLVAEYQQYFDATNEADEA